MHKQLKANRSLALGSRLVVNGPAPIRSQYRCAPCALRDRALRVLRATTGLRIGAVRFVLCILCVIVCGSVARAQDQPEQSAAPPPKKDDKLGERLIRQAAGGEQEDVMGTIVRLMTDSAHSLEVDFDAGGGTQTVQGRIVKNLDDAIKTAAAQRRLTRQSRKNQSGDKRRMDQDHARPKRSKAKSGEATAGQSGPGTVDAKGQPVSPSLEGGALKETRRAWGRLPERQRDELIQGSEEGFLAQYRTWIEMYYKALQESE
jgi:hypothetical protein